VEWPDLSLVMLDATYLDAGEVVFPDGDVLQEQVLFYY
jgi:hypothetical protein